MENNSINQTAINEAVLTLTDSLDPVQIYQLLEREARTRAQAKEVAIRPTVDFAAQAQTEVLRALKGHALRPSDSSDQIPLDTSLMDIRAAMDGGNLQELVFLLIRHFRAHWLQFPHMGQLR